MQVPDTRTLELIASLQQTTVIWVSVMISVAAIATALGFAILGSKFMESAARQPEVMDKLMARMFVIAALLDAIPMITVAIGLLIIFGNPFVSQFKEIAGL